MTLTLEEHLEEICPICKKRHNKDWESKFDRHNHYLTLVCECGYEIFIRTRWLSSGVNGAKIL